MEIEINKSHYLWKYATENLLFYGNRIIFAVK